MTGVVALDCPPPQPAVGPRTRNRLAEFGVELSFSETLAEMDDADHAFHEVLVLGSASSLWRMTA